MTVAGGRSSPRANGISFGLVWLSSLEVLRRVAVCPPQRELLKIHHGSNTACHGRLMATRSQRPSRKREPRAELRREVAALPATVSNQRTWQRFARIRSAPRTGAGPRRDRRAKVGSSSSSHATSSRATTAPATTRRSMCAVATTRRSASTTPGRERSRTTGNSSRRRVSACC
jgi:hypothetical protein